ARKDVICAICKVKYSVRHHRYQKRSPKFRSVPFGTANCAALVYVLGDSVGNVMGNGRPRGSRPLSIKERVSGRATRSIANRVMRRNWQASIKKNAPTVYCRRVLCVLRSVT